MKNLLCAIIVALGVIFVFGFVRGDGKDRLRLTSIKEKRGITLVVSMPDRDTRYVFLHVFACASAVTESGVYCIDDGWESTSDRLISRSIEPIPFPDAPRGTVRFMAYALDIDEKAIASDTLTLLRGF
jgi:hypothetical protein